LIRKVVAGRSPSPGPGHYSGMTVHKERTAISPPPKSILMQSKHANTAAGGTGSILNTPGYSGYSFGKSKLEKCMPATVTNGGDSSGLQLEFRRSTFLNQSISNPRNNHTEGEGGGGGGLAHSSSNPSITLSMSHH